MTLALRQRSSGCESAGMGLRAGSEGAARRSDGGSQPVSRMPMAAEAVAITNSVVPMPT